MKEQKGRQQSTSTRAVHKELYKQYQSAELAYGLYVI